MYKILLVSPDGIDYVQDCKESETIEQAWDRCNDLGSKWFFYPICFVIVDNGSSINTKCRIIDTPDQLEQLQGVSITTALQFIKDNPQYISDFLL